MTGLPHRIVVDEAHYFLHEPNVRELVDPDLGAYTLVTDRLSDLHPDLRKAIEGIVKRTIDLREVRTLLAMAGNENAESEWKAVFAGLTVDEAVRLPGIEEAGGKLRRFQLSPRLTIHVRHKAKSVDLQLIEGQGFVFTDNGKPVGSPARTLNEFVSSLKILPLSILDGHARRGDFSQWIGEVFRVSLLYLSDAGCQHMIRLGHTRDLYNAVAESIQERYEMSTGVEQIPDESLVAVAN
jgi:hypothetical protein